MKRLVAVLAAVPLMGCLQGQESFDVSETQGVDFPGLPAAAQAALVSATTESHMQIDLRKQFASLGGQPSNAVFSQNGLSGSALALIAHVHATISAADGSMPDVVWSDAEVPADSTEVELPSALSGDQFLKYLEQGPVNVHFVLTGSISTQPMTLTHTLHGHMTVAVDEKL
jgi:hypothetical protein